MEEHEFKALQDRAAAISEAERQHRFKTEAHKQMMLAWVAMHDHLGGPVDENDAKEMNAYIRAFNEAANDYCAIVEAIERASAFPAQRLT